MLVVHWKGVVVVLVVFLRVVAVIGEDGDDWHSEEVEVDPSVAIPAAVIVAVCRVREETSVAVFPPPLLDEIVEGMEEVEEKARVQVVEVEVDHADAAVGKEVSQEGMEQDDPQVDVLFRRPRLPPPLFLHRM